MDREEGSKAWAKVIAKCWSDEAFKKGLEANPREVLKEYGIEFSEGTQLHLHENTRSDVHISLPAKPSEQLTEQQLEGLAAGSSVLDCGSG